MDMYGVSTADHFRIDDLLDFSNADLLPSSDHHLPPPPETATYHRSSSPSPSPSTTFTDHLFLPSDEVEELEWLSHFVDDSFSDFPESDLAAPVTFRSDTSFPGRSRSKRSRSTTKPYASSPEQKTPATRKCTHCASEKTPQWRTGPLGPKTLCNACGVRYKSGRLVPEYRPAASPTFVLTQHSNSHRKVMELRRQKGVEMREMEESGREVHVAGSGGL